MSTLDTQVLEQLKIRQSSLAEEQLRVLFKGIPISIATTVILDLLLSISHWQIIGHGELLLWNGLMFCAIAVRIVSWFLWRNTRSTLGTSYWLTIFRGGTWLAGAIWGSSAYFMYANYNPAYDAMLAFTLAGVASGAITTLAIDKLSVVGFVTLAIIPLSVRIHLAHDPIAIPMSIMTLVYIAFVLSAASRARRQLETTFAKNERLIEWGNERIQQQLIDRIVSDAQSRFIADGSDRNTFEALLNDVVAFSESKMGFIAEVFYDESQSPYLSMLALSDVAWDKKSKAAHADLHTKGMQQTNLNTLFGAALTSSRPIISNTPAQDMRAGGIPNGHPALSSFMGVPIFNGMQMIGMLALANNAAGYEEKNIDSLKPILNLIAQFILATRHNRQHQQDAEQIQRQVKRTQAILDEAFDAIISIDCDGNISGFNHSAEIIFGYHADQIMGKNFNYLIAENQRIHNGNFIEQYLIAKGKKMLGVDRELLGLRRNGKEFPIELAISEVIDEGQPTYICMVRDISERQHTEKLKHDFIATISHELRTPLTSVSASLALIESGSLGAIPDKISSLVKIAKQNSLRLQNLISDLLDMDKLLSNQLEFNVTTCDAFDLLQKAISDCQYLFDKHQVKVQITNIAIGVKVHADGARVQQVLDHLLSNAAKFSPPFANIDIAVTAKKNWVKFSVTDHGSGIPNEFKPNIFHSFTQADSSNTRSQDGTGLGLAISKELIEKMGGKIGFTSSIGQGSSFFFELPSGKTHSTH